MQVQIKFLTGGANSLIGGFVAGDIARVSEAHAKHLVDEVGCAQYVSAPAPKPAATPAPSPAAAGKKGKK